MDEAVGAIEEAIASQRRAQDQMRYLGQVRVLLLTELEDCEEAIARLSRHPLLPVEECAALARVSRPTIYRWRVRAEA